uniref:CD99 antigen-like protein 2 n=1 Tax=Sphenodon punctatus TaxID=8508 RepID=A0A8D0HE56_SPHPU
SLLCGYSYISFKNLMLATVGTLAKQTVPRQASPSLGPLSWQPALSGFVPSGTVAETGTIAGIASALAMALIGAVSSYISYQQKKFCFSIQPAEGQEGLNAEYVKGENMEAVVTEEPQVKYSALETQSAEPPPPQDNAKV